MVQLWPNQVGEIIDIPNAEYFSFHREPPVDRSRIKQFRRPKVLACGVSEAKAQEVSQQRGFKDVRVRSSATMGYFWVNFFGRLHFLDSQTLDVPSLIVASGTIRHHDPGTYMGHTFNVRGPLKRIAKDWGIPIVFV